MSHSLSQQVRAAIRRSDRKDSQLLGVTLTRVNPLNFRLRLGTNKPRDDVESTPSYTSDSSHSSSGGYDSESESEGEGDLFVWDVSDPFAPPDPSQAFLQSLIQAEIAQMRRYEMIGPLQTLPDQDPPLHDWDESDDESDEYDDDDGDDNEGDNGDSDDFEDSDDDADGDDEDDGCDDDDEDSDADDDKPNVIVLPKLLHTHPLRFIPSPSPQPPPPPPSSPSGTTSATDEDTPALWIDLQQAYDDIAEVEECAARKAKRDAHRSRLKALAILGPEATSAI